MNEEKKYITFRDLRAVAKPVDSALEAESTASTTSITSIGNKEIADASTPSTSSTTSIPSNPSRSKKYQKDQVQQEISTPEKNKHSVSPENDFQKVPNSVTRSAIPEGLFRGKSKQVWDYLWSITRGAIVPVRTARKSRREIKAGSGLGSMVTVDAALAHLEQVGLIAINQAVGSLSGNEYEVFTPEETTTSTPSISRYTSLTQKVDILDILDSSISSITQTTENKGIYSSPNTFLKTKDNDDDDDAFAEFAAIVEKAAKEITGKEISPGEKARWGEVAEVLMTELRIAAGRTTVSSIPAFLAEHLRRRLWKKEKRQIDAEAAEVKKTSSAPKVDVTKCPDCFGTGMYYPDSFEKGVARCSHATLGAENDG